MRKNDRLSTEDVAMPRQIFMNNFYISVKKMFRAQGSNLKGSNLERTLSLSPTYKYHCHTVQCDTFRLALSEEITEYNLFTKHKFVNCTLLMCTYITSFCPIAIFISLFN